MGCRLKSFSFHIFENKTGSAWISWTWIWISSNLLDQLDLDQDLDQLDQDLDQLDQVCDP